MPSTFTNLLDHFTPQQARAIEARIVESHQTAGAVGSPQDTEESHPAAEVAHQAAAAAAGGEWAFAKKASCRDTAASDGGDLQTRPQTAQEAMKAFYDSTSPKLGEYDRDSEMPSVYNSTTQGPIPLSIKGRYLLQDLRHAIMNVVKDGWQPHLADARAAIAKRMGELEASNRLRGDRIEVLRDRLKAREADLAQAEKRANDIVTALGLAHENHVLELIKLRYRTSLGTSLNALNVRVWRPTRNILHQVVFPVERVMPNSSGGIDVVLARE